MSTPTRGPSPDAGHDSATPRAAWPFTIKGELTGSLTAGALLGSGVALGWLDAGGIDDVLVWVSLAIGLIFGGKAALESLRLGRVDIDVLMVVAAVLAAVIGHPAEGALLLFLFVLAGALEDAAAARTEREVRALHRLMPDRAEVKRGDDWAEVAPTDLAVGDVIRVRPGSRVPADAAVTSGRTFIDQSAMTGESEPREVAPGDEIYSGTINVDDAVEARVIRPAAESSLQRVLDLVTRASEQREPVQRAIDRLSQPYALSIMALCVVVILVWAFALGRPWDQAAYTGITLLIVASPCALVIATPTATLAGIARGARTGVLFKGGQTIERLAAVGAVCFDKTGTLTFGRPRLTQVTPVAWSDADEMLRVAAALERASDHPIAHAVLDGLASRGLEPAAVDEIDHTTGRGLSGRYAGLPVSLGSYRHVEPAVPVCLRAQVLEVLDTIRARGQIGVVVAQSESGDNPGQAAVLVMTDAVRPGAAELVSQLHALGVRPVRMLTGDHTTTAQRVAGELGIDLVDAELMPEDKLRIVGEMRDAIRRDPGRPRSRRGVAVIGDGVNDAPALAAADVSLAIGTMGTDAALESADIVLLADDLAVVPWAVGLARRVRATVWANLLFAGSIILGMGVAVLIASAIRRPIPMSIGVLAHEGGTVLVVLNSLRLLAHHPIRVRSASPTSPTSPTSPSATVAPSAA